MTHVKRPCSRGLDRLGFSVRCLRVKIVDETRMRSRNNARVQIDVCFSSRTGRSRPFIGWTAAPTRRLQEPIRAKLLPKTPIRAVQAPPGETAAKKPIRLAQTHPEGAAANQSQATRHPMRTLQEKPSTPRISRTCASVSLETNSCW